MKYMLWFFHLSITFTFAMLHKNEPDGVPKIKADEYVFVLKRDISANTKHEFEVSLPITPSKIFSIGTAFHCYFFDHINNTVMNYISSLPGVSYVEPNRVFKATAIQKNPPSWGLKRIWNRNLPLLDEYVYSDNAGNGVDVYVIDSGIYVDHNDLPNAIWGATFNSDGGDTDCDGHGTHIAGTIGGTKYGVAKNAKLIAVKVLDCRGSAYLEEIVAGIEWVAKQHLSKTKNGEVGKSVANLALGGQKTKALADAVDAAVNVGIHFSVAGGNNMGDACAYSPSDSKLGIIVAAADIIDLPASFSNMGTCITLWAPGTDIISAGIDSKNAEFLMSGTSVAAPHVAGAIALFLADSTFTISPSAMRTLLTERASKDVIDYYTYTSRPTRFFTNLTIKAGCTKDSDCARNYKCCPKWGGYCLRTTLVCCGNGGSCRAGEACCDEQDWVYGCCFEGMECHNDETCRNGFIWDTPNMNLYSDPPSDD